MIIYSVCDLNWLLNAIVARRIPTQKILIMHVFLQNATAKQLWKTMVATLNIYNNSSLISLKLNE